MRVCPTHCGADCHDDWFEPNDTQSLNDWHTQQRVGCEQRSDDDRRNERIAKTEAQQGADNSGTVVVKSPKMIERVSALRKRDLEPGGKHQQ